MSTLTPSQLPALNAAIKADSTLNALPNDTDGCQTIANAFNLLNTPDWWAWKSNLTLVQATEETSVDGTNWSWPQFIARTVQEQNGWLAMWSQGSVNPSLPNVRQGFADIFSGNQAAPVAQRTHLAAVGRRKATRAEQLYTTGGNGTTANPATFGYEGFIDWQDVNSARNLG